MTRRGQHAAFEVLFSRYQSRLLAFCRHMLVLARGRRGRAPGGVHGRVQRGPRRRARDQRPSLAVSDRAQPLAQPPAPRIGDRRGLDGRPLCRQRPVHRRARLAPRELPPAARRRQGAARDPAHRSAAARDRRALLRADRRRDGDDRAVGQVAARARAHLAGRGRRGTAAELRRSPRSARRGRRGPDQARARPHAGTCAGASAAARSRSSSRTTTTRSPRSSPSGRCCWPRSCCSPSSARPPPPAMSAPAPEPAPPREPPPEPRRAPEERAQPAASSPPARAPSPPRPSPGSPPRRSSPRARSPPNTSVPPPIAITRPPPPQPTYRRTQRTGRRALERPASQPRPRAGSWRRIRHQTRRTSPHRSDGQDRPCDAALNGRRHTRAGRRRRVKPAVTPAKPAPPQVTEVTTDTTALPTTRPRRRRRQRTLNTGHARDNPTGGTPATPAKRPRPRTPTTATATTPAAAGRNQQRRRNRRRRHRPPPERRPRKQRPRQAQPG